MDELMAFVQNNQGFVDRNVEFIYSFKRQYTLSFFEKEFLSLWK